MILTVLRSGWTVIAVLLVNLALYAFIIAGTFPVLRQYAGGLDPFDGRPLGYSLEDARALLAALGETGRAYYANTQLWIDTFYPATYGVSRALSLFWLASPGRIRENGFGLPLTIILVLLPIAVMFADWTENAAVFSMLSNWQDPNPDLVRFASAMSAAKSLGVMVTDVLVIALFAWFGFGRWRVR